MNIITVIPLTRSKVGGETGTLSYFTASEVPIGAVVSVPLRSKSIHAVVTDTRPAEDIKAEVRSAPFEIRKLNKVKANAFFPTAFIESCKSLSEFYATNVGAIMKALVSEAIMENANKISPPLPLQASFVTGAPIPDETYAVQGDDADRFSTWRSLIRQEFARKRSIAFYAPSIEDAKQVYASLEKGIEGYIFLLHGSLTPKKLLAAWEAIFSTDHPVVIVSTGSFSVLPRGDIGTVVIERENSRGWLSQRAPYLDFRHAIEEFSRKSHRTVYLADSLLRAETLHRLEELDISEGSPMKWRSISTAKDALVNMRREKPPEEALEEKPAFRVLSPELEELIKLNQEESAHLFILSTRRGLSSITVCSDCETIVTCGQCSAPVVLHTSKESGSNFFLCHKCGERRAADEQCANCGGWRLTPLGIGIDKVNEEIAAKFPEANIFKIDSDTTKTENAVNDVLAKFKAKPGSILLGTEMVLPYLSDKVDHAAVASLDSLFALPDFRIQERVMYLLVRLRNVASRSLLVQTRRPEEKVFEYGMKGNLSDFYHATLSERKQFEYPPFSVLIKITMEGKKPQIAKDMGELQAFINPHEIEVFPAFTATVKGASIIHGLVKLQPRQWPDHELVGKLRSLPPDVSVKVNPESLL
jgi:primosomal protein N'